MGKIGHCLAIKFAAKYVPCADVLRSDVYQNHKFSTLL